MLRTLGAPAPSVNGRRRLDNKSLASGPVRRSRRLRQLALGLFVLGVVCRLVRYGLRFPFWGDEAFLCVNFLDRGYLGLTHKLECNQVAPLLFLWGELTAYRLLGASEWAMRLLPLLAGLASLGLFWHLARTALRPGPAVLAFGLLAVARWPVTMSAVVKPYSFDLFFSLALLVAAVHHLRRPGRVGWLLLLALLAPVAVLSSYPAVLVAGGISLTLLPSVWRSRWPVRASFVAYNLLLTGAFLGSYLLVGTEQLDPATGSVQRYMVEYWRDGFPPADLWSVPAWLVTITSGRMMAYPIGDANGGSTLTLVLFLVGAWRLARRRRWQLLGLCLLPFALNLVAAFLRRYPYGGCCRLSQHLAPAVCLLAGTGLAWVIGRAVRPPEGRGRWAGAFCGALALFGFGQLIADIAKPYRDAEALWSARLAHLLLDHRKPADQVVVCNPRNEVESLLRWQLGRYGERLSWGGRIDWERLEKGGGDLWCVNLWSGTEATPAPDRFAPSATIHRPGWVLLDRATYTLTRWAESQPLRRCDLGCWAQGGEDGPPRQRPALGCWPP